MTQPPAFSPVKIEMILGATLIGAARPQDGMWLQPNWGHAAHLTFTLRFIPEFCRQIDPLREERRFDRDAQPPTGWCIKNFAGQRAVNYGRRRSDKQFAPLELFPGAALR
ncbi:MAG: hypothetical protein ONB48_00935 [candidate division KSB1 bacterium]|nr:hypothetical protein [candidate division KSB1 bacterium]MDZ7272758.1 hypothetical protein [candidate division KSB1 bacterium]MDZ7284218.1 hypothetical protein [candidate division KSB1 bacterium]MDZ7297384.1 hypothetical protein [candidate division KSB1 bacterium]MDZ7308981.1 hypothetical protein [candidate division KSB1 bacterium]